MTENEQSSVTGDGAKELPEGYYKNADYIRVFKALGEQRHKYEAQIKALQARVDELIAQAGIAAIPAPAAKPKKAGEPEAYKCDSCETVFPADDVDTDAHAYECGECGSTFTSDDGHGNRCEDCNKFAAAKDGIPCPDCGDGSGMLEPMEGVVTCPECDHKFVPED